MRVLVAESGEHKGTCWTLSSVPTTIGRGSGCRILLSDAAVSRIYCNVRVENGTVQFKDQASRNATLVNRIPTSSGQLEPGDKITIGDSIFSLFVSNEKVDIKPDSKKSSSTIHILPENVSYLQENLQQIREGNPQTVSDLYWLFTSSRKLSASHIRETFMKVFADILQERFTPDGILIR